MLNKAITLLNEFGGNRDAGAYTLQEMDCRNCADWLKSIKDRLQVQPQNVWISVDKEVYVKEPVLAQKKDKSDLFDGFVVCCDHTLTPNVYERYMILGNIVSQNTWKPSDEQMRVLEELVEDNNQRFFYTVLKSLYEQLKKLKEE